METKIPLYKVFMAQEVNEPLLQTLHSGWVGQGQRVFDFEMALSDYLHRPPHKQWVPGRVVALNSCTSAMELALSLIDDGTGGEIITNPIACLASVTAILSRGFTPHFADIDPYTGNLDILDVFSKVNEKTKGVLAVHFCGQPMDVSALHKASIPVIEDCAQALGSELNGVRVGASDKLGIKCLSFQSVKTLTTTDGGAIVVPNVELYQRAKKLRWYGLDRDEDRYSQDVKEPGFKFAMNDVMATIGLANITHLERLTEIQRNNWKYYDKSLSDQSGLRVMRRQEGSISACPLYPILVENKEGFCEKMKSAGIDVALPHGLCTTHSCVHAEPLSEASWFHKKLIAIPAGWWVGEEESEYIVKTIKEGW